MTASDQRHVHRPLHLTTPPTRGEDVRELQARVNAELAHRKFAWRCVSVDGELGRQTLHAAAFTAWLLGLTGKQIQVIKDGARLTEAVQHLLRNPAARDKAERRRDRKRRDHARKLRAAHRSGPQLAVTWMLAQVGVHERPAESNLGPGDITIWEQETGYAVSDGPGHAGVFWCGCFAHHGLVVVGEAQVPEDHRFGYGPYLIEDCRAARNGMHAISSDSAGTGDFGTLWGGEHIVTLRGSVQPNGLVPTVEGNTSAADGSQNNGGCVAAKERSVSDFDVFGRIDHWG